MDKDKTFTLLVSRDSAKRYLTWELKRAIKTIMSHVDSIEFSTNNKIDEDRRRLLRSIILDNINGLHKAWIFLSPIQYFDLDIIEDMEEYRKIIDEMKSRD